MRRWLNMAGGGRGLRKANKYDTKGHEVTHYGLLTDGDRQQVGLERSKARTVAGNCCRRGKAVVAVKQRDGNLTNVMRDPLVLVTENCRHAALASCHDW